MNKNLLLTFTLLCHVTLNAQVGLELNCGAGVFNYGVDRATSREQIKFEAGPNFDLGIRGLYKIDKRQTVFISTIYDVGFWDYEKTWSQSQIYSGNAITGFVMILPGYRYSISKKSSFEFQVGFGKIAHSNIKFDSTTRWAGFFTNNGLSNTTKNHLVSQLNYNLHLNKKSAFSVSLTQFITSWTGLVGFEQKPTIFSLVYRYQL